MGWDIKKRTDYTPNISYLDLVCLDSPCYSTAGVCTCHGSSVRYVTENPETSDADYNIISFRRKQITGLDNFRFLYCRRYYERNQ